MKKIIFLMLVLVLTSVAFAESRRNLGTARLFDDDSDKISAKDIYEVDRSFGALGYNNPGDIAPYGAFGIKISPTMYLGVIGGVKFDDEKTVVDGGTGGATTTTTTYKSPFNATVAFALNNNMGFHYTITRDDATDTTTLTKSDTQERTVNDQNSAWLHEIAFGMKLDNGMEFYIPLGVPIALNTTTTKASGTSDEDIVIGGGSLVSIALNPTFSMPLDLGLFNKLEFNAGVRFGVYNDLNKIDSTVGSTTTKRDANKKWVNTSWAIGVTPTFEWDLSEKISFMSEPTVNFFMNIVSQGQTQNIVTNGTAGTPPAKNVVTRYMMYPSINIPIGVVMKPC